LKQITAKVSSNEQVLGSLERRTSRNISGSWLIRMKCPEIAGEAVPGQFVMARCGEECILPRPFSVHRAMGDEIALFYAVWEGGRGTGWLAERQAGEEVTLFGPLGNGFTVPPDSRNLLLVAGGTGIAPLYFLAEKSLAQGQSVVLLKGASGETKPSGEKNPDQHYPKERLPKGIEVHEMTSSADGKQNMVTELIPEHVNRADQIFACGPVAMYRNMADVKELKNKPVQISLEMMMGCGLGVCYGCTIRTKHGLRQVCRDGPIFELQEIDRDELGGI
jgi:dihydroorotate dehydrogenase electron transfer subunit